MEKDIAHALARISRAITALHQQRRTAIYGTDCGYARTHCYRYTAASHSPCLLCVGEAPGTLADEAGPSTPTP